MSKLKMDDTVDIVSEMSKKQESVAKSFSTSPWPAWSLAGLFFGSSLLPPQRFPRLPPFPQRLGFAMIMSGAGYVLSTGDAYNGSGISTAWTLAYLFWNGRRSVTSARTSMNVLLTGSTAVCAWLYSSEYFLRQDWHS